MSNANLKGFKFIQTLSNELSQGAIDLPSFPDIPFRIEKALKDPDVETQDLVKIIITDPVFATRLMNVANSAAVMGSGKPITDVRSAITRIGFKMAHTVAMSVAMNQALKSVPEGGLKDRFNQLWRHSLNVAAFSFIIAKNFRKINPDEAMITGLMHDIGKIYILSRAGQSFPELADDSETLDHVLAEWHSGIGKAILQNWGFNEAMSQVADEHELLHRAVYNPDLTDIVLVANLFAKTMESGGSVIENLNNEWQNISSFGRLKIDCDNIEEITEHSMEEVQSIIATLGS
jgi:HD-like signal output (HDOD) protein